MSNQSSCTQHDEQIPALLLSVAKVCITCLRNSGHLKEIKLITAGTPIKNSDLQKQEFQQLAKTKEIRNGEWGPSYACILDFVFTPGALQHVPHA